jgi:hypothetical protein
MLSPKHFYNTLYKDPRKTKVQYPTPHTPHRAIGYFDPPSIKTTDTTYNTTVSPTLLTKIIPKRMNQVDNIHYYTKTPPKTPKKLK